ncbi:MAG: aspartyl protease family protein [Bacteroidota bacterium]
MGSVISRTILMGSLFLAGLLVLPQPLDAKRAKDISVPFQLHNGLIILQAEIDGQPGNFILDTGADAIIINGMPQAASELLETLNGEVKAATTQLNHLKVGAFIRYDVAAQVTSLSQLEHQLGIDLYGIIGGKFFLPSVLVMDFSTGVLTISTASIKAIDTEHMDRLAFRMVNNIPIVQVEIETRSYQFALDSGASIHLIDPKFVQQFHNFRPLGSQSKVMTLDRSGASEKRYILDHFALGEVSFMAQQFLSYSLETVNESLDQPLAGIISLSQLNCHRVVFDLKNQMLYLQAKSFRD